MRRDPWEEIGRRLFGGSRSVASRPVGGGCIHDARVLEDGNRRFFVKANHRDMLDMFRAEADGLEALRSRGSFRVPEVIGLGESGDLSWLAMEHLDLRTSAPGGEERTGIALAELHRETSGSFGWHRDNYLGSAPQPNARRRDWVEFLAGERLGIQFERAEARGRVFAGSRHLLEGLGSRFADYTPVPSLLHGDLWHGNRGFTSDGLPCMFDPAVHYGDREAEFGIIGMFGGFGEEFHHAYERVWPLDPGFGRRRGLYLLYHQLNHFNLFGDGYAPQVESTLGALIGEGNTS